MPGGEDMMGEFGIRNSEFEIDLAVIDVSRERLSGIQISKFKIQNLTRGAAQ
jgi:hypothetical protein